MAFLDHFESNFGGMKYRLWYRSGRRFDGMGLRQRVYCIDRCGIVGRNRVDTIGGIDKIEPILIDSDITAAILIAIHTPMADIG